MRICRWRRPPRSLAFSEEMSEADQVRVVVYVYDVFWDPVLFPQILQASGRILGFHVR